MRHKLRDVLFVSLMLGSLCKLASPQGTPVGVTTDPIPCPSTGKIIPAGTRGDQLDSLCPPSGSGASTALTPQHQMLQAISPTVQGAAYNFGFALGQWLFGAKITALLLSRNNRRISLNCRKCVKKQNISDYLLSNSGCKQSSTV